MLVTFTAVFSHHGNARSFLDGTVLPGCNNMLACTCRKKTWDLANTIGVQQHLCTGATRQPAGQWRHGDVTGPRIRIKLALCVFDSCVILPTSSRPVKRFVTRDLDHTLVWHTTCGRPPRTIARYHWYIRHYIILCSTWRLSR